MKIFLNSLTLCACLCLNFDGVAQYKKILRGEISPYDTGVVIQISEYRKIRNVNRFADSLVASLNREISGLYQLQKKKDTVATKMLAINESLARTVEGQKETIVGLSMDFDELNATYNTLSRRSRRKVILFTSGGVVAGAVIYAGITAIKNTFAK